MPPATPRACICGGTIRDGACSRPGCLRGSKAGRARLADQRRGSRTARGYDEAWSRASAAHLRANPLCVYCAETCTHCGRLRREHAGAPASSSSVAVQAIAAQLAVRSPAPGFAPCSGWLGRVTAATCTDHVVSVRERPDLRMDPGNWAASCARCNTRKANLLEGGGWGP